MSLISDLQKIEAKHTIIYLVLFLANLSPGFLVLYIYKPSLIAEYDIFKLILFSLSLTSPVFLLDLLLVMGFMQALNTKREIEIGLATFLAAFVTFTSYYISILLVYFLKLKFIWFISILICLEILILIIIYNFYKNEVNDKDKLAD